MHKSVAAIEVEHDTKTSKDNLFFTILNAKVVNHMIMHILTMMCGVETSVRFDQTDMYTNLKRYHQRTII